MVGQLRAPVMIVDRKTISIMKACELVGVSRRTIYNWISSGKVEYVRTAGGSVRIFVDTLWREPETGLPAGLLGPLRRCAARSHFRICKRIHSTWRSRPTAVPSFIG